MKDENNTDTTIELKMKFLRKILTSEEGDGNEELISKQQQAKRELEKNLKKYKIYTNIFDEIINATDLCDSDEELSRLRKT